jgi:hypothetical protein
VLWNNCSHTIELNGPEIGLILVISCRKPCKVTTSLSNEDIETCHAANIAETILYSGDSPVSRANCEGDSVARVGMSLRMLYLA